MIVNRKDDIDPSDTRFEWMVLVLLGNEFCIYTRSFVEVGLSRTFFARDWRWLACDRWWTLISCRGNWGSFVETPFLGRGSTYIDLYRWIFNYGGKIVNPTITDNASLSFLSYKLLLIINPRSRQFIQFYTFYKIETHFFYPLSNNKNFLFSSYKLSFVIGILIPDVTIKNSNYRILSTLCLSQNWNPPNFFFVEQRYLPQIWKRRDESHKLTISNISIISEPIVHRPFDLSRFQEDSNVTIPRLDHVSSPRAGNSVSGEDTVQRTTKLFYATRSANSTIGSAPDPVFFALTNFERLVKAGKNSRGERDAKMCSNVARRKSPRWVKRGC